LLWPGSTPGAVFTLTNKEDEMEELIVELQNISIPPGVYGVTWNGTRWEIHTQSSWFNKKIGVRSVQRASDKYDMHFVDYGTVRLFCMIERPEQEPTVTTYDPASDEADVRQV
jgi:hypothetical protein